MYNAIYALLNAMQYPDEDLYVMPLLKMVRIHIHKHAYMHPCMRFVCMVAQAAESIYINTHTHTHAYTQLMQKIKSDILSSCKD